MVHKSETILIGTQQRLRNFPAVSSITMATSPNSLSDSIKILGVVLDENLTFNKHSSPLCKSAFFHIRALRHIRPSLADDMASVLWASLLQSRLDYANSLLFRSPAYNLRRLQRVQNSLSRVVPLNLSHLPTSDQLHKLH